MHIVQHQGVRTHVLEIIKVIWRRTAYYWKAQNLHPFHAWLLHQLFFGSCLFKATIVSYWLMHDPLQTKVLLVHHVYPQEKISLT